MVEWKKLGEVEDSGILTLGRGQVISKIDMNDCPGDFPVYSSSSQNNGEIGRYGKYMFDDERITWSIDGGGKLFYRNGLKYSVTNVCGWLKVNDGNKLNTKFLYYLLFEEWTNIIFDYNHKAHPSVIRNEYQIPIIPLEEQTRIVGILDTFTSAIDNLKEQIAQRRKQYEYYRDQLLDLEGKPGVEMKFITDVAKSFTGLTYKPENVSDSGTLVLRSSNINDDVLSFDDNVFVQMEIPERARVQENDILICVRNGSKRLVGKAAMITKEAEGMAFGAFMTILRSFAINSKFLFYVWQSEKVRRQYKGDEAMPIAQITAKDFQRIVIPVPPLSEQQRIVSILDTFEASIQNLEAQLKERQKQYEYYRNKLLTFE